MKVNADIIQCCAFACSPDDPLPSVPTKIPAAPTPVPTPAAPVPPYEPGPAAPSWVAVRLVFRVGGQFRVASPRLGLVVCGCPGKQFPQQAKTTGGAKGEDGIGDQKVICQDLVLDGDDRTSGEAVTATAGAEDDHIVFMFEGGMTSLNVHFFHFDIFQNFPSLLRLSLSFWLSSPLHPRRLF
ncbi:hypothetical protein D9619_012006 [Psilocybe cf. subviscida]|uniref:Uncharacterized protein n=1 Tax=Psilocybe cf. subviscida TaxID=2480587 RepID=A0A8H5B0M4_9AGAR|nr:hypothetical protein D9619_012006 [Psilocybe cf. subviscida]